MKKQLKKLSKKLHKHLTHCKEYVAAQRFYLKDSLKCLGNSLLLSSKMIVLSALVVVSAFSAVSLHSSYIESHVGSNSVMIKSPAGALLQGSGSGFEVKAPSGKVYTVTNAHVCGLGNDGVIMVEEKRHSGRFIPRHILEIYQDNDLCLIEGLAGYEGLSLSNNPSIGQSVWAVGYPMGEAMDITSGRIKGYGDVEIMLEDVTIDQCKGPSLHVVDAETLFFTVKMCVITRHAVQTSLQIFPGNSGSPMVNVWGDVVGVVFASERGTNWGSAVPVSYLKEFLKAY